MRYLPNDDPFLTLTEAARWSGRSKKWWRSRLNRIPYIKDGVILLRRSDLQRYLEAQQVMPGEAR